MIDRYDNIIILLLFSFALFINHGTFHQPLHPDEPTVINAANSVLNNGLDPKMYRYPAGFFNLLALAFKIQSNISPIKNYNQYQMARVLSRIMVASIAIMVFIICSMNVNKIAGITGAVIVSFSNTIYTNSNYAIVDIPTAFFTMLFFFLLANYMHKTSLNNNQLYFLSLLIGVSISMKYTAALLIPVLIINSYSSLSKNHYQILSSGSIRRICFVLGASLTIVGLMLFANHQSILGYLQKLTTDGIIEIEYINTFNNFINLIFISGMIIIIICLMKPEIFIKRSLRYIISPLNLYLIMIISITFILLSPFTIIELKKSFADFMYEYRHMKIGSAAQYHHSSDIHKHLLSKLSFFDTFNFYKNSLVKNIGIVGILVLPFGFYNLFKKNTIYFLSILVYLLLVIITILGWRNIATRYTLSLYPLLAVILVEGLQYLGSIITDRLPIHRDLCYCILASILMYPMINDFISYFHNV